MINQNNKTSEGVALSKILIAIDGSELSMDAADYAIYISSKFNSELYIIHIIEDPAFVNLESFGVYDIQTSERKAHIQHILETTKVWFDKIKETAYTKNIKLLKTEVVGTSSSIASAVVDYAERNAISLIVVGTKGRSGIKKLLLGSVASGVTQHARCPVMVVK